MPPDAEPARSAAASPAVAPWAVYLLACAGGKCYVGISPRPEERFATHCAGRGGAFTRANPPQRCVRVVWFDNRRAAASLEARLKATTRERKWRWFTEFPHTTPAQAATIEAGLARLVQARTAGDRV